MKKLSLLLSTVGGAMGGYLLSNKKLRDELSKTDDAESAAKTLGKHLQRDGKKLAEQLKEFINSEEVQSNLTKAKKYAKEKTNEAKKELNAMVDSGTKKAKTSAQKAITKGKKKASSSVKKTKARAKKATKKVVKRVKAQTRKLSQ
ncbi:MAG: hypothetical protein O2904_04585 [bacterium]|nr:hypothetical protein [bacterium]